MYYVPLGFIAMAIDFGDSKKKIPLTRTENLPNMKSVFIRHKTEYNCDASWEPEALFAHECSDNRSIQER